MPIQETTVPSPLRNSAVKSNIEESANSGGNVKTSDVDTTTNLGDSTNVSTPKQTIVIPPKVSNVESSFEEVSTLDITTNISNMDENVNMGEGDSHNEASKDQDKSNLIVSSTFETSTIDTSTSLLPFISTVPTVTHSPTFDNILNQTINSLFSSQSTDPPITHEGEEDPNDEGNEFDGTFASIEFDLEEENILDNMSLTGKQFKILNRKLNSLLQIQVDREISIQYQVLKLT